MRGWLRRDFASYLLPFLAGRRLHTLPAPLPCLPPQLLLACVALLNSSVVRVVEQAMHLLLQEGRQYY